MLLIELNCRGCIIATGHALHKRKRRHINQLANQQVFPHGLALCELS